MEGGFFCGGWNFSKLVSVGSTFIREMRVYNRVYSATYTNKDRSNFFFYVLCIGNPCMFGRAEILVILGLHFGRNNGLINSF